MAQNQFVASGNVGENPNYEYEPIGRNQIGEINNFDGNFKKWFCVLISCVIVIIIILLIVFPFNHYNNNSPTDHDSIFGGMYSIAEESIYSIPNRYTNELSCSSGYTAYTVGYFNACYKCGAIHLCLCLKDNLSSDPLKSFGGIYSTNNCGGMQYQNPLTDMYECQTDDGYKSHLIISSQTDQDCNINIYACFADTLDYHNIGGFYTEFTTSNGCITCSKRNVNNPMLKTLGCPDYYERVPVAHAYSPGGFVGCPGCDGMVYICQMPLKEKYKSAIDVVLDMFY
eukprot:145338_1